jgi:pyrroloquinoline quinone biosynthesis protein B
MRLRILGSAAGGGFPQWNCACPNCAAVRARAPGVRSRTQDALAVEAAPGAWFLINASPDVHRQIEACPALQPDRGRATPIRGVVLLNGDLDHTLGLFSLRENTPLVLHATESVWRALEGNTMLRTLQRFPGQLTWRRMELEQSFELQGSSVTVVPVALPGKVPKHLEGVTAPSPEDNVGLWIHDARTGKRAVIATAAGELGPWVDRIEGADAVLFDGTFWSSDELIALGLGTARAADMAHLPIGGDEGSLARLAGVRAGRRIYTHINNTNPILVEGSAERRAVEAAGWEVAEDGLEIEL